MAVEVGELAGPAEMLDTQRSRSMAWTDPSQASVAGCPSITVTMPQLDGTSVISRSM
jgi:hypothetical protein